MVDLPIREDHRHNIFVAGLSEESVDTVDQFNEVFLPAARNRWLASPLDKQMWLQITTYNDFLYIFLALQW